MMLLVRVLINAVSLLIVANYLNGVHVESFWAAVVVSIVMGVVNAILRPILILISLPIEILTLGLFTFVINGALFALVASFKIGLRVDSLWSAIVGAIALSIVSFLLSFLVNAVERA